MLVTSGIAGLLAAVCLLVPAPSMAIAPGIVELPDRSVVRASVDGFVVEPLVQSGDNVAQGDVLMKLTNKLLETEHRNLALQIEQEQIRYQEAVRDHDADSAAVIQSKLRSLRLQLGESQEHIDGLTVRAPVSGRIIGRQLDTLKGTYLHEGDEILAVEPAESRQFRISIDQQDFAQACSLLQKDVEIRVGTRGKLSGQLTRLNPRASRTVPNKALSATMNGPLAVKAVDDRQENSDEDYELVDERFDAVIELAVSLDSPLCAGERGQALLGLRNESIGRFCYRTVTEWIDQQLAQALQQSSS